MNDKELKPQDKRPGKTDDKKNNFERKDFLRDLRKASRPIETDDSEQDSSDKD